MADYWIDRQAKAQNALTDKSIAQTEKQLTKYYSGTMRTVIDLFIDTYNRVADSAMNEGRTPTPADLYKLDTYWKLQGQLAHELDRLGAKQEKLLSREFMNQWQTIYKNVAIKGGGTFTHIDLEQAYQMINAIWCADGKSWSNRIWMNTDRLREALNEGLTESVIAGVNPDKLKARLMKEFNVSYNRADALVRTEMAHIQTTAAEQRYKDAGVKKVQVWAKEDERLCDICGKLHEKEYILGEKLPIPAHTKCRCCIVPVIEDENALTAKVEKTQTALDNKGNAYKVAQRQEVKLKAQLARKTKMV